jgi:hypothetical protein
MTRTNVLITYFLPHPEKFSRGGGLTSYSARCFSDGADLVDAQGVSYGFKLTLRFYYLGEEGVSG